MARSEVKVLGTWASQFAMRPRIALNLKSVNYEFIEEKKLLEDKSQLLLQSNPVYKKVPVFFHGDNKPICESLIIVQYIDETWSSGPSILPTDPYERAVSRFWAAYLDNTWYPAVQSLGIPQGEEAKKAAMALVEEGVALMEEAFGKCSKGKAFFGGDEIGYLDIAFGSYLGWLRVAEKFNGKKLMDEAKTPTLVNWAESFCSHAAVKDFMPDTDKLAEYANIVIAKIIALGVAPETL
ncbi:Glutathione S-transferase U17 [Hibiscus syriacus]|uniref:glutathione transferase n=1 Tax=Hibiscus syriacus TaxID=106335 RepID=A0A6A2Z5D2_HIBSY|nr:glutathione S-transferase U17-like [Hibiscus syriacus]KAE8686907.1 Glutathione S-transferase U17 [Hibiscus syriacus]